jgi:hypothetical protein
MNKHHPAVDQGTRFGTWDDPTSRLIYHDAMPALLSGIDTGGRTLDLGGGNGLACESFEHVGTVDVDPDKNPDVLADILSYTPPQVWDRVLLRYVLHYLDDDQVHALMMHIASYHHGPVVLIQFVNQDLDAKYANSVNELKWFRTEWHLRTLVEQPPWCVTQRLAVEYDVAPEFYANRLGAVDPTGHPETVVSYLLERC